MQEAHSLVEHSCGEYPQMAATLSLSPMIPLHIFPAAPTCAILSLILSCICMSVKMLSNTTSLQILPMAIFNAPKLGISGAACLIWFCSMRTCWMLNPACSRQLRFYIEAMVPPPNKSC